MNIWLAALCVVIGTAGTARAEAPDGGAADAAPIEDAAPVGDEGAANEAGTGGNPAGEPDAGPQMIDETVDAPEVAPPEITEPPPPITTSTIMAAHTAHHPGPTFDYVTPRLEPAGFPIIGFNSDIGIELGAVATLSKLGKGVRPYEWNMDIVAAVSFKTNPAGNPEVTQQNYLWQIDVPGLRGGTLRVNPAVAYVATINQGYFGLGNASSPNRPATIAGEPGRYFQYEDRSTMLRELTRIRLVSPVDLMIATTYRYESPTAYDGSALANDAAAGRIRGLRRLSLPMLGVGVIYDTRDNEYFPRDGAFHQVGVRGVQALPFDANVQYMAFGAIFAAYRELGGPFVLAGRFLVDAEFGNVPFYDLFLGEPFSQDQIIGGSAGVRGVPEGRYLGKLKTLANLELRALLVDFQLFRQSFQLGGDVFGDTGRVWSNYTFSAPLDGTGLGLKWGVGAGVYVRWGQAGVFRIEAAYSPDAVAENPSFPIGLYVQDGVMF